jgi:hypothetical protein
MANLKTEVDAILECDKCRQAKAIVRVELMLALNGSVRSNIAEIILPDGWAKGRTVDGKTLYICEVCSRPKLERIYG